MIQYSRKILSNGLVVLVHEDRNTQLCTLNILYNVGARDEDPDLTGFAHLFEHLMFGGTERVPNFDLPIDSVGGENNAFTSNDCTNYYITVPSQYLETALWLESDRMRGLDLSPKSLEVQQHVVTEEYNQRYLNTPYADLWLHLRPLCYSKHPYRWCAIGRDIKHVEMATLEDVKNFFAKHYLPNNAILCVAGNVNTQEVFHLVEKWFGDIPAGELHPEAEKDNKSLRPWLPQEPEPTEALSKTVYRDVPADMLLKAYLMPARLSEDFYVCDFITDILAYGETSRLTTALVKEKKLFSDVDAVITAEADQGLVLISGKLNPGISMKQAEEAIEEELRKLIEEPLSDRELQKLKNTSEVNQIYSNYAVSDRAWSLCYYEWLGDVDLINHLSEHYNSITQEDISRVAGRIFAPQRCRTLYYLSNQNNTPNQ